ncbi:MAG: aminoglycoside phosphotransferase family protein [Actinomycetota bacterium]|nr:aminoglycoside phosphotransferase family protein [Actinomycetota bacterium]
MARPIEQLLTGGNVTRVVRIGDTVRRPAGPWSAGVDALLGHLEAVGFAHAPRALGYDRKGRQVLSYVPGEAPADPSDLDVAALGDIGRLIAELHGALATFRAPASARWSPAIVPPSDGPVCHNDVAPWNLVRGDVTMALIDWDGAAPAPTRWDLAYAVQSFVPLAPKMDGDVLSARLVALVEGYGLDGPGRVALLDTLGPRTFAMVELLRRGARDGVEPWQRLHRQDGPYWEACAAMVRSEQARLATILGVEAPPGAPKS